MWVFIYFICFYLHCVPVCLISNRLTRLIVKQLLLLTISVLSSPPTTKSTENSQKRVSGHCCQLQRPNSSKCLFISASSSIYLLLILLAHPVECTHQFACVDDASWTCWAFAYFIFLQFSALISIFQLVELKWKFCNKIWILLIKCLEILHFLFLTHFSIFH